MLNVAKKQIRMGLVVTILIIAFTGGQALTDVSTNKSAVTMKDSIKVIDGIGRVVTLTKIPERIIVLTPGYAETLYAIGCGDRIVAVDNATAKRGYPPQVHNKTTIGRASSPSLERIIALDSDLIIAYPYSRGALLSLESKIPIYYVAYEKSFKDVMYGIRVMGLLTNHTSEAKSVVSTMQLKIKRITDLTKGLSKTKRPLVYYETSSVAGRCAGPNTFGNDLIYKAGGINIAADEPVSYPRLSSESIIEKNPDVILIVWYGQSVKDVKARSGWGSINAVRNNRVYKLSNISCVGPRAWMVLEEVAKYLHPELFKELN